MIVLNSLADAGAGFGTDTNKVSVFYADSSRSDRVFDLKSKSRRRCRHPDCIEPMLNH